MVPFIAFDLSGGANIAGSNVLIGKQGGQQDFLSTAGYSKLGLPGDMTPNLPNQIDQSFGLAFHIDSAFLRGLRTLATDGTDTVPAPRLRHYLEDFVLAATAYDCGCLLSEESHGSTPSRAI